MRPLGCDAGNFGHEEVVGRVPVSVRDGVRQITRFADASARRAVASPKKSQKTITLNWLREHESNVVRAVNANPFWRANIYAVEANQRLELTEFLRILENLGYERVQTIARPGEYASHGGVVELWPVNRRPRYCIEFYGNVVESIEVIADERYRIVERSRLLGGSFNAAALDTIKPGEFVVHIDHGIGVFRGMRDMERHEEMPRAYYVVEYAKGDTLLVPEDKKERLSIYVGLKTPDVHRLGSNAWQKTRRMVRASAMLFARDLVKLYARRELEKGFSFGPDNGLQREFEEACPFEETIDQRVATDQIKDDMASERPMERLLAGDVGFGKTEVAMRAAFKAVCAGKQVAVLAPTTVLAYQHYRSFSERMNIFSVRVALLTRMQLPTQTAEPEEAVLVRVQDGSADVVIGTHRLLSKDIHFKNLGLLIIDEEQKFGVRQKEKLKELKANLDVLLLSATPIPRTLNLALSGLREMSIIATPPPGRMPIETYVLPDSDAMIREALSRELKRNGQVYVLWNRVETMTLARRKIIDLAPKGARIEAAHGKMDEVELIGIMERFRRREIDVLVATTIIENGLDFDNVNTLVVINAARLGLSQSYQLRGRIGRGDVQAFAYFLYPDGELTENAKLRLEALEQFTELGSGYRVALKDLEIRGAGNILGKEQSGNVYRVGLHIYLSMLAEAIEELQGKEHGKVLHI